MGKTDIGKNMGKTFARVNLPVSIGAIHGQNRPSSVRKSRVALVLPGFGKREFSKGVEHGQFLRR